jgi:hypothetical protein
MVMCGHAIVMFQMAGEDVCIGFGLFFASKSVNYFIRN